LIYASFIAPVNNELTSDNFNPDPFLEKKSLYKTLSRDGSKIEL